jgi:hypothetical protein
MSTGAVFGSSVRGLLIFPPRLSSSPRPHLPGFHVRAFLLLSRAFLDGHAQASLSVTPPFFFRHARA